MLSPNHSEHSDTILIQKAIASGIRFLAIREHSEKQIEQKLLKKGFASHIINESLTSLCSRGYLSNERYCFSFVDSKKQKGQGPIRIEYELQQQAIPQSLIDHALKYDQNEWDHLCLYVLQKKNQKHPIEKSHSSGKQYYSLEKAKLIRFMQYRGFSLSQIQWAFKQLISSFH
jgi:regulatory protein